ncbi:MAG: threonylcarbamoyladenosine tRNA methylthiotransferase, partial [Candidatus Aenigmatarchaeota archaeon]
MKIYVETYGCALNKADTEVILGILTKRGIRVVDSVDDATIVIVNTCGVKAPTEFKILKRLRELRKLSKPIIVAGCLPKINLEKIKETLPDYAAILGPDSYESLPEIILQIMSGRKGIINLNGKP